jgi:hypothetical protein
VKLTKNSFAGTLIINKVCSAYTIHLQPRNGARDSLTQNKYKKGTSIIKKFLGKLSFFQQNFISCPPDSTVSEEAGTEPKTVARIALAVKRSNLLDRLY